MYLLFWHLFIIFFLTTLTIFKYRIWKNDTMNEHSHTLHLESTIVNIVPHWKIFLNSFPHMDHGYIFLLKHVIVSGRHYDTSFFNTSSTNISELKEYSLHNHNTIIMPKKMNNIIITFNVWYIFKLSSLSPKCHLELYIWTRVSLRLMPNLWCHFCLF